MAKHYAINARQARAWILATAARNLARLFIAASCAKGSTLADLLIFRAAAAIHAPHFRTRARCRFLSLAINKFSAASAALSRESVPLESVRED